MDIFYTIRRLSALEPVNIDGLVFKLHYWVTSTALFGASMVSFAKQYFGDPIECIFDAKNGAEIKAVDAYCWIHSTVNLETGLLQKLNTLPKIRAPCHGYPEADYDIDTLYYQWVPFFLLFQALIFRIPWHIWRHLEGGRISEFGLEAKRHLSLADDDTADSLARQYAQYFRGIFHRNNVYFWQFYFCECLNILFVIGMIFMTDSFLNGRFLSYGRRVMDYYFQSFHSQQQQQHHQHQSLRVNPMCSLFPTVTSCQFPTGALTGNLNVDHAMCVLSLNIVNDKIFLLQWFWFIILAILSSIASLVTCFSILCPSLRKFILRIRARHLSLQEIQQLNDLLSRCYIGDWFVLNLLAKNTNAYMYRRIIKATCETIREGKTSARAATISIDNLESRNGV